MKFSILSNDKTTAKDELIISIFTLICLVAGVLLIYFKPTFLIVGADFTLTFGVFLIITALMFIPCIIYRLHENYKDTKDK